MLLLVIGFFPPLTLHIVDIQHCIPRVSKSHPVLPPQYQARAESFYTCHLEWMWNYKLGESFSRIKNCFKLAT